MSVSTGSAYQSLAATTLATTTETAVITFTIPQVGEGTYGQGIYFGADAIATTGTAATGITLRLRQGTGTAGTIIGNPATSAVAAASANQAAGGAWLDPTTNYPAGNTYTVTAQQGAATGNGTMQQITVSVLPAASVAG